MPIPKKGPRLGGSPSHQKAILANLATSLFEHGAITTTEAKARVLRPYAERLITKAKRGDLHNRRQVASVIRDKTTVHVLFTEIGPRYAERPGGYTRITKLGPRKGDSAPMAVIELVEAEFTAKTRATKSRGAATGIAPAAAEEITTDETASDEATTDEATTDEATTDEAATDEAATDEAATDQVEAQEAVAEQEPAGETVEAPADGAPAEEVAPEDVPADDAATDEAEDDTK